MSAHERPRHTVPTHLTVPDKVLFGLTARQLLILLVGCCLAYQLWFQLEFLAAATVGQGVRLVVIALLIGGALAFSLVAIAERPLEQWLWIALRYWRQPKTYVWRSLRFQQSRAPVPMPEMLDPDEAADTPALLTASSGVTHPQHQMHRRRSTSILAYPLYTDGQNQPERESSL